MGNPMIKLGRNVLLAQSTAAGFAVVALTFAAGIAPALAQTAQGWGWCADTSFSADVAISSCTRVIEAGHDTDENIAVAYLNCGIAYDAKSDGEHAVADYSAAIRLDPTNKDALLN